MMRVPGLGPVFEGLERKWCVSVGFGCTVGDLRECVLARRYCGLGLFDGALRHGGISERGRERGYCSGNRRGEI